MLITVQASLQASPLLFIHFELYKTNKQKKPLKTSHILDMHCCMDLFPASKCPIWCRHATVVQRCVNLAVPKHTQLCCQELDYLKQVSVQMQR